MARALVKTLQNNNKKNILINGDFNFAQRGTSFLNGTVGGELVRGLDRWNFWVGGVMNSTLSRQTSLLAGGYAMRVQRNAGQTTNTNIVITQHVDLVTVKALAGKTVTLSFYVRKGANFTAATFKAQVSTGTASTEVNLVTNGFTGRVDQELDLSGATTTQQRFSITATIPANALQLAISFFAEGFTGTAGAADWYELEKVMLTEGSDLLPFVLSSDSYGEEFLACQRYYRSLPHASGLITGASTIAVYEKLYPTMRGNPAPSVGPGTLLSAQNGLDTSTQSSPSMTANFVSPEYVIINIGNFAGLTVGRYIAVGLPANNTNTIRLDAEI